MENQFQGGNFQDRSGSNQQFDPNQQSSQPNQFNRPNPNAEELPNEDRIVNDKITEINHKNIIKTVVRVLIFSILAIIVGKIVWSVIQGLGDQGSTMGYTINSWFENVSIDPGDRRGFSNFLKLLFTGVTLAGCLYAFNKFFSTKR